MNNYTLLNYLNHILQPEKFEDYCPNGLQIEGNSNINKIVTGVSLTEKLIDAAINMKADAIIVHHGIFWHKDDYNIVGIKHKRISKLLNNGINLYAYHLPLDNHAQLGNNIQLANLLGVKIAGQTGKQGLLWYGKLPEPLNILDFSHHLAIKLEREPQCFTSRPKHLIRDIAWCTGGADSLFNAAINLGVDAYITGEASEPVVSMAEESGIAFITAGHYATERYGIMALTEHIVNNFDVKARFIELYNPI